MSYTSQSLLTERFGAALLVQLTDRAAVPTGLVDPVVVGRAVSDTDAVIDGYLAGRYVLPLGATPPLVADLALSIAIYKLHPFAPDPKIEADYKDAVKALEAIAKGVIRLPIAGVEVAGNENDGVVTIDRTRDMTPENMRGFI